MKITKTETNNGITSHQLEGDTKCPCCSVQLNGVSTDNGQSPRKGDLSVCLYFAGFLKFTGEAEGSIYSLLSEDEFSSLSPTTQRRLLSAREFVKERNRPLSYNRIKVRLPDED